MPSLENENFMKIIEIMKTKNLNSKIWIGAKYQKASWKWSDGNNINADDFFWTLT